MSFTRRLKIDQLLGKVDAGDLCRFLLCDQDPPEHVALADEGRWRELLNHFDVGRRNLAESELGKVEDLANENGMRALIDRLSGDGEDFDRDSTPHGLAFFCRLNHPTIFERVYDQFWLEQGQRLVEYKTTEPIPQHLSDETVARLASAIRETASREAEGRQCAIKPHVEDGRCYLFIHHRGYRQVIEELEGEDRVVPRIVRPSELSAVIIDSHSGMLKIRTRKTHVQERLRRLVGEILFQRPEVFDSPESTDIYTLNPLKTDGFEFSTEAADPIKSVALTELALNSPTDTALRLTFYKRYGIGTAPRGFGIRLESSELLRANIRFQFSTSERKGRSLTVTIKPSNICTYDHSSPNAHYVEKYLRKWNIYRA